MKVILNNLEFFAYHGLYDFEKRDGGTFFVDIEVEEPVRSSYETLDDVINYEELFSVAEARMAEPKEFIEEVARLILSDIKHRFPLALKASVKLTKASPPIKGMKGNACVVCSF